jgi:hypothetical protein
MMQYESDPYYSGRLADMQMGFLNYGPAASSSNPDIYSFSGNAYSLQVKAK